MMTGKHIHTILAIICICQCQADENKGVPKIGEENEKQIVKDLKPKSFVKALKKGMGHKQLNALVDRLNIKTQFFTDKNRKVTRLYFMRNSNSGDVVAIDMKFLNSKLDTWELGYKR